MFLLFALKYYLYHLNKMLHEILLALIGHTGSLIVYKHGICTISSLSSILTDSERALLTKICELATNYLYITQYIQAQCTFSPKTDADTELLGDYAKALCVGIDNLLSEYKNTISIIEKDCINGNICSIASIIDRLYLYYVLFPIIRETLTYISTGIKGGALLQFLYQ